jgi:DNA polymerase III delta prime subunit
LSSARSCTLWAKNGWDSTDTTIEGEQLGPYSVDSLRALLAPVIGEEAAEDLVGQLLAEEAEKASIVAGVRRNLITKMGLRDQPILNQYQDEIFRLPIDARLLILGPPGTGKTTTLIRRLGQKLDLQELEGHEKRVIENVSASQELAHSDSWLMFTPTELLKQYLKEAFAREGVPAPDQRIQTWVDYRHDLARNAFNILRSSSGGGTFVLKSEQESLSKEALEDPINWYEDFDSWQRSKFIQELRDAAAALSQSVAPDVQALGTRLLAEIERSSAGPLASMFSAVASQLPSVRELASSFAKHQTQKSVAVSIFSSIATRPSSMSLAA